MSCGFHVATDTCYGCKTCTVACANEHLLPAGVLLRRVRQIDVADPIGHAFISMACNHCDDPACLNNCPVQAYTKLDNGLVVQNHDLCIGCQACIEACPFHAPAYNEQDSTTYKCDGCIDRLNQGLEPVCMMVCPSANIAFSENFESLSETFAEAQSIKDQSATKPNMIATLDSDISIEAFADIDGGEGVVDRGGENY